MVICGIPGGCNIKGIIVCSYRYYYEKDRKTMKQM